MAKYSWNIDIDGRKHVIEMEHGYLSGKRKIRIDGKEMQLPKNESSKFFDSGSNHKFQITGHELVLSITASSSGLSYEYNLFVDGRVVTDKTSKDSLQDLEIEAKQRRLTLAIPSGILGLTAILANWFFAFKHGFYYDFLAFFGPPFVLMSGYYLFFKDDPTKLPNPVPLRFWILIIASLLCGIINTVTLSYGFFIPSQ